MESTIKWLIHSRFSILALLILLTAGAAVFIGQGVFATSLGKLLLGDSPGWEKYLDRISRFASDEAFIVAFEDDALLSQSSTARLRKIIDRIEGIEEVGHVDSLIDAQRITVVDGTLYIDSYADLAIEQPENREKILSRAIADLQIGGLLISENGKHSSVIIELLPDTERPAERGPLLLREVLDIFKSEGFDPDRLHSVGMMAALAEVMHQTELNIIRIFPFVCLFMLLAVYLMFRRLWPVFITLTVSSVAVIWSFAFAILLDRNINIFISVVPAVILIVATSDVVHLCSAYMLELGKGYKKREAILKSGSEVGRACLLTSATTFLGFIALTFVPTPAFKQLGWVMGFGVAISLLFAMTLCPILFSYMKPPKAWSDSSSKVQRALTAFLQLVENLCKTHPWSVVVLFAVVLLFCGLGLSRLNIETDLAKRMDENNRVRIDENYFNQHFAGATFLEIFIDAQYSKGLLDDDVYAGISSFQKKLEKLPGVDKAVSFVDVIETIHQGFNPEQNPALPFSLTRQHLAQYLLLFSMSGGKKLDRLLDDDRKSMRIAARLSDGGMRAAYASGEEAASIATKTLLGPVRMEATGASYLMGQWLASILDGQRNGLVFAFFSIAILMMLGLRSLSVGLWSMIPNAIPLIVLGGYVGLFWDRVDSDTLAVAMIAIGIGVDDTIHFLMRLKTERQRGEKSGLALTRTFEFTGRAIVITTIILVVGFLPFSFSDYFSIRIMGTLLPMTLAVALAADLLLVPALYNLGLIGFKTDKD